MSETKIAKSSTLRFNGENSSTLKIVLKLTSPITTFVAHSVVVDGKRKTSTGATVTHKDADAAKAEVESLTKKAIAAGWKLKVKAAKADTFDATSIPSATAKPVAKPAPVPHKK